VVAGFISSAGNGHADALFLKRDAFSHEQEVRLLYVDAAKEFADKKLIEVPIDLNAVIEEITLDPRVRGGTQEYERTEWLRSAGFNGTVNRSSLYQKAIFK